MFTPMLQNIFNKIFILVLEGTYLYEHVVDPYDGDLFHESPLILVSGSYLLKHFPGLLSFIFITLDLLTAFCLAKTAELFMHELVNFNN